MEEKTKVNKNKPKDSQDRNNKMNIVKNLLDKGKKKWGINISRNIR